MERDLERLCSNTDLAQLPPAANLIYCSMACCGSIPHDAWTSANKNEEISYVIYCVPLGVRELL